MKNLKQNPAQSTSGTCFATIKSTEVEFSEFEGVDYLFYKEDLIRKEWAVSAKTAANSEGEYQLISFWIPREGNVREKTYEITESTGDAGKARATWAIANGSAYTPYLAISGSMTVSVNESSQTLEATFHFEGEHGTKQVTVSEGKIEVKGLIEEKHYSATGSVTCDLDRSVITHYVSTSTNLSKGPAFGNFPAYIKCWSEDYDTLPNRRSYVIAIDIAESISTGTYPISSDSQQVRVFFIDRHDSYPCQGESGSITLDSIPDIETLEGVLSGHFNFTAVAGGTSYVVEAKNGKFNVEKTKA